MFPPGVATQSSTAREGGPSPRQERPESRAFRKSGSPISHPPRFRSRPGRAPVSANATASPRRFLDSDCRWDVGVPNQSHILDLLHAHHAFQWFALLVSPKRDAVLDFMTQFIPRHVWFCPAIRRDDAFIGARAIVDDGPDQFNIAVVTATDHAYSASCLHSDLCRNDPDQIGCSFMNIARRAGPRHSFGFLMRCSERSTMD